MNPALYDPKRDVWSVTLYILSLPGLATSTLLFVALPLVLTHLVGMWWLGAALLAPWWYLLLRLRAILQLLFIYLMVVLAVIGWGVLVFGLRMAGVY